MHWRSVKPKNELSIVPIRELTIEAGSGLQKQPHASGHLDKAKSCESCKGLLAEQLTIASLGQLHYIACLAGHNHLTVPLHSNMFYVTLTSYHYIGSLPARDRHSTGSARLVENTDRGITAMLLG